MEIVIGKKYVLNEDLKSLYDMNNGEKRDTIPAGTECEVIEYTKEAHPYLTIRVAGLNVRTEDHMIDEIK